MVTGLPAQVHLVAVLEGITPWLRVEIRAKLATPSGICSKRCWWGGWIEDYDLLLGQCDKQLNGLKVLGQCYLPHGLPWWCQFCADCQSGSWVTWLSLVGICNVD